VALKSIEHYGANQYFIYEFLVWRSGDKTKTRVLVNVTSTGSFSDFLKDVPFTVEDGSRKASGTINIPIHPLDPLPLCKAVNLPSKTSPLQVDLSGNTEYTVSLDCNAAVALPRLISLGEAARPHREYWKDVAFKSKYYGADGPSRSVPTKLFDLLDVTMTPNVLAAAGARLRRFSVKDSPDDTIAFDLTYAIQPAGLEVPLKIEIPVTFYPSPYVTASSLSLGTGVGWLATWLMMLAAGGPKPWKVAGRALLLGLLLAIIAYVLALLAYTTNCRVKIFGQDVEPFDMLVLFVLGVICGCVALVKVEELLKWISSIFARMNPLKAPLFVLLLASLLCPSAQAEVRRFPLVGLSACPDGSVIGLETEGGVIQFASASRGQWRRAGSIGRSLPGRELTCATVDGKNTAFVVAVVLGNIWVVRMDLASGIWSKKLVERGVSAGIAFDADSQLVFLSSASERAIYSVNAGLASSSQWASIFERAQSISSLAVDSARKRLLVGEAFSGVVYSLALDTRRQSTLVEGLGTVNSLNIDRLRDFLYIADRGRRAIWVVPLAGEGPRKPRVFHRSSEFDTVSGVAADGQSNVWVAVYDKANVVVFSPDGTQVSLIP
jgi:hypothetical protein